MPRVTIIPEDNTVIVDGVGRTVKGLTLDKAIRAVQWGGEEGEVELAGGPDGRRPPNLRVTDLAPFQAAIAAWEAAGAEEAPQRAEPKPGSDRIASLEARVAALEEAMAVFRRERGAAGR